jgi:hypothetical protein
MQDLIDILNKVFKDKHTGTYIDIGAYDGVTDNVTNHFYEIGWRGVCIEPQTKYHKLGKEARPEDFWIKGKNVIINNDVPRKFAKDLDLMIITRGSFMDLENIDMGIWKPNIVVILKWIESVRIDQITIQHMNRMGYYHLAPGKTGDWLVFSNNNGDRDAL